MDAAQLQYVKTTLDLASLEQIVGKGLAPGHSDRIGHYQYTHTGRLFFSCDPRADEVCIDDIAIHLSRIPRFGGATDRFMSVAEHCWHCSHIGDPDEALERLLHDAAEAYIGDLIRPLKYLPVFGPLYLKIERGIEVAIADKFDLAYPWPASVKWADEAVVGAEVAQNIVSGVQNHLIDNATAAKSQQGMTLHYWSAELAAQFFLQRFHQLWMLRYGLECAA